MYDKVWTAELTLASFIWPDEHHMAIYLSINAMNMREWELVTKMEIEGRQSYERSFREKERTKERRLTVEAERVSVHIPWK